MYFEWGPALWRAEGLFFLWLAQNRAVICCWPLRMWCIQSKYFVLVTQNNMNSWDPNSARSGVNWSSGRCVEWHWVQFSLPSNGQSCGISFRIAIYQIIWCHNPKDYNLNIWFEARTVTVCNEVFSDDKLWQCGVSIQCFTEFFQSSLSGLVRCNICIFYL
jgi:hypothetical protein